MSTPLLIACAILALCLPAQAQDRTPAVRAATVAGTAASGLLTGLALGARDGVNNDLRWAVDAHGYSSPEALRLNDRWHTWGYVTKPLLVVQIGGGVALGTLTRPDLAESLLVAASWGAGVGLGFHTGHNLQQGKPLDYFGTVDATDGWARTVGPRTVLAAAVVGSLALWYLTYEVLR